MDESAQVNFYSNSFAHILAELSRLDLLLRVQVWRVRQARQTGENLSAFYVPEAEIDTILDEAVGAPIWAVTPLPPELQQDVQTRLDRATAVIADGKAASQQQDVPLRLGELSNRFRLSTLDQDILLVALAPEIDPRYARLYAYLQDNINQKFPSVNLALSLLLPTVTQKMAAHRRLAPGAPLRKHQLLHLATDPGQPHASWLNQGLVVDRRIVRYLLDGDEPDDHIRPLARLLSPQTGVPDRHLPEEVWQQLPSLAEAEKDLVLYFQGQTGVGRQDTAVALCAQQQRPLLFVNGERLAQHKSAEFAELVTLIEREARLQQAALYWQDFQALLPDDKKQQRQILLQRLAGRSGLTILAADTAWEPATPLPVAFARFPFPLPDYERRLALWQRALPDQPDLAEIANKFRLNRGQIQAAAATAQNLARRRLQQMITTADLYDACRLHSNQKLAQLAQKVEPHYEWTDIVLPPLQMDQLREICEQVQHRALVYDAWGFDQKLAMGKGLHALFAGPPGTGKTMAADIIAGELGLDLYKIDLSTVVSKYIGETEKNLSRIFTEAESSNAILFFDEADALFGKRTEVRDAHDRYANLEISYLLQRMEAYAGITILATNLHKNMDDAFRRRMHFIVEFPFPSTGDRRRIWRNIWPAATPRSADLDLDFMAEQIQVTGGNIRNIALTAAFLAAADGRTVTMAHLIKATRREYQKIGKLLTGKEFVRYQADREVTDA